MRVDKGKRLKGVQGSGFRVYSMGHGAKGMGFMTHK
jgi:hypothetical protein